MAKRKRRRKAKRTRSPATKAAAPLAAEEAPDAPASPEAPPRGLARWLPHLIGAFVLFHVAANSLSMIPNLARALDRSNWDDPRVEREMRIWAGRLGVEQPVLEDELYDVAVTLHDARATVVSPFEPYMRYAGLRQSWMMFTAGTQQSDRFGVRVRRCELADPRCDWELLYLHADAEHDWRADQLGFPRLRSAIARWGWPSYAERYTRGCASIAQLAFADHPDALFVECGFQSSTLHSPELTDPPPPVWTRPRLNRRPR